MRRGSAAAGDALEHELHRHLRHPADGLGERRERRVDELGPRRVVDGGQRDVLRHTQAVAA